MNQPRHSAQQHSFSLLKHILEAFPDGVFTLDHNMCFTYVNPAFCKMMGFSEQELLESKITDYLSDLNILSACQAEVMEKGACRDQETVFKRKDGTLINISKNVQMLLDDEGKPGVIVSIRDMTELHELNKQLVKTSRTLEGYNQNLEAMVEERTHDLNQKMAFLSGYKKALDVSSLVSKCSLDKEITHVNPAFCHLTGYFEAELLGQPCTLLWSEASKKKLPEIMNLIGKGHSWKGRLVFHTKFGEAVYLEMCIVPINDENNHLREVVNIGYDVTPLVESSNALCHRLHHDALTELPNRLKLLDDTENNANGILIALFNIDSFNEINAFYGMDVADKLLKLVAECLQSWVKELPANVYKLPVDEYALVLHADWPPAQFERYIQGFLEKLSSQCFVVEGAEINITSTAGLASSAEFDGNTSEVLIAADMALKRAKRERKPCLLYDPELNIKQGYKENQRSIKRLRSAMEEDRLQPFYQPIVNRLTLEVERYECLVRIVEESGEVISPYYFLDVSKKLKLYSQLTMRVIEKSLARFANESYEFSINLSIEDITDPVISSWILNKVQNCRFAERIIFEIVESEGIQNYDDVNHFIQKVKRYGVKIAIDDFGAGYSNFAYIMQLDVDYIKIDGSIIRDIHRNPSSQVITQTILDFARKLNIKTVAEFVSDEEVYQYVKELPVDSLQGYLFGEPRDDILDSVS
ncbi:EAL domain-containing protein [Thiomicrorhabdus sp. zzn3]|uniref:bifunctional diguanylate cyclase/phosphodiesterase n=1 Tax=Thiomicrorhabdus sp. zzn3 TaxID=3039775 RepID=UPI002436E32E|nr:EAL domain-containing protein [Thiomicrorhabdus sp. zzn3]MDG6777808.1 EAL domain-containing protein [Thiomicrorhabdus sp. zzn3]